MGSSFPNIQTLISNTDIRGNKLLSIDGAVFSNMGEQHVYLKKGDINSLNLFPNNVNENSNNILGYSHFLSDVTFLEQYRTNQVIASALNSWIHTPTDLNNTLDTNSVTQTPWIKARNLGENSRIIPSKGLLGNRLLLNIGISSNNDIGE